MSIFKPHLSSMSEYSPPLAGRNPAEYTLLDFNERTIPVSDHIKQALKDFIDSDQLQTYPFYGDITKDLADYCGVQENQVIITNGSDHGIELAFRGTCREGDEVIIPVPTFPMYHQVAGVEGLTVNEPEYSLTEGFPTQQVLASITENTQLIVIPNPNNPSGTLVPREDILNIAKAAPNSAILVDECYFEYTTATVADVLEEFPNLIITRTFSKTWGIPSLRFGYILSCKANISALLKIRGPYDINQLAVVAANAAMQEPDYRKDFVREIMTESKPRLEAFLREKDISFWRSAANYLWMFPNDATAVNEHLKTKGILVRPKKDLQGNIGLRITIGTKDQTEKLIELLSEIL